MLKRMLEVKTTADCVRIHDGHRLVAVHALLDGRRSNAAPEVEKPSSVQPRGHSVARRGLEVYAAVAKRLGSARCGSVRQSAGGGVAMSGHNAPITITTDRIRRHLVGLKMPRALEALQMTLLAYRVGRGQRAESHRVTAGRGVHNSGEPADQDGVADGAAADGQAAVGTTSAFSRAWTAAGCWRWSSWSS